MLHLIHDKYISHLACNCHQRTLSPPARRIEFVRCHVLHWACGGENKLRGLSGNAWGKHAVSKHAKVRKACHKSSQQTNTTMRRPRKLTYRAKQRLPTSKHVDEDIVRHAACNTLAARCEPSLLKQAFLVEQALLSNLWHGLFSCSFHLS